MEFYELNRLYDQSLASYGISHSLDHFLYSAVPVLVTVGCAVSLLTVLVLLKTQFTQISKTFLLAQSICNLLFQIVTSIVLISNNYERQILEQFTNSVAPYLRAKIALNFVYNVFLYACIWLLTIGSFDIAVLSIIRQGVIGAYTRVYYKLFVQQLTSYNKYFNCTRHTDYTFTNRAHLNPVLCIFMPESDDDIFNIDNALGLKNPRVSVDSSDLNEAAILETEPTDEVALNYSNYMKNQQAAFCSPVKTLVSIFSIVAFSILLGLPQFYGIEVKINIVSVSPSAIPVINNEEYRPLISKIYFIQEEVAREENPQLSHRLSQPQTLKNYSNKYQYSINMATAYGLDLKITQDDLHRLQEFRTTHPRFFNITGAFDVSARHYSLCNTLENSDIWRFRRGPQPGKPVDSRHPTHKPKETPESILSQVVRFNLTLTCVSNGAWNGLLMYNTLYFWLEHTVVVSVPICFNIIVLFTMVITYVKTQNIIGHQARIAAKRRTLNHCVEQLCQQTQPQHSRISFRRSKTSYSGKKNVQIITDLNHDEYEDDVFYDPCASHKEVSSQIELEANITRIQADQTNINLLFITDLALFCSMAFPYTCMRLVLALFDKDRIKISLDFFVLYKLTLVAFHLHLISKFFLLAVFSVRFRIALAYLLAIEPVLLGVSVPEAQAYANERHPDCCLNCGCINKPSSGEFFDVSFHTKMASNYEDYTQVNSVDCNLDTRVIGDDDDLTKTNV